MKLYDIRRFLWSHDWIRWVVAISVLGFATFPGTNAQDQGKYEWEKIVPLVTSKGQVEELFGKPIYEDPLVAATYPTKFGKLTVWYLGAADPDDLECRWNLPMDTVGSIYVALAMPISVSRSGYDLKKFDRSTTHVGRIVYTNLSIGLSFVVDKVEGGGEEISALTYSPTKKQIECNCTKKTR
jgi:hypothetical protein